MHLLLLWLALPLAAGPVVARGRSGSALARLMIGGFVLAVFWQGVGTLDPGDLAAVARSSPEDARFVAFTAGAGLLILATRRGERWVTRVLAWPLAGALLLCITAGSPIAAIAGIATMAVPWLAGGAAALRGRPVLAWHVDPMPSPIEAAAVGGATLAVGWWAPFAGACLAATAIVWWVWARRDHAARVAWPVVPLMTTAMLSGAGWLVLTIAESPFLKAADAATAAPISPAAATLLALLVLGAAVALASPWPAHLLRRSSLTVPAAVLLAHTARVMVPGGADHWLPLLSAFAVVSVIGALVIGRPLLALAALAVLGGAAADRASIVAALVLAACTVVAGTWGDRLAGRTRLVPLIPEVVASGAAIAALVVIRGVLVTQVVWAISLFLAGVIATRAADTSVAPH